jgi:hypothetical protein
VKCFAERSQFSADDFGPAEFVGNLVYGMMQSYLVDLQKDAWRRASSKLFKPQTQMREILRSVKQHAAHINLMTDKGSAENHHKLLPLLCRWLSIGSERGMGREV